MANLILLYYNYPIFIHNFSEKSINYIITFEMTSQEVKISQDLIKIPSYSGFNEAVLKYIEEFLVKLGFECENLTFDGDNSYKVNNLHAIFNPNKSEKTIYFAGHTDVVNEGDLTKWEFSPFSATINDGKLYGRGACDMKCALACFLAAAQNFIQKNPNPEFAIGLLITNDEESDGVNGTKKALQWMKKSGKNISACIVGEPTNPSKLGEMVKIGRRGSVNFDLEITGKQGHVAYADLALNPITALIDSLQTLNSHVFDDGNEFFPPTNLEITSLTSDNFGENVIPFKAQANFNIRFNSIHTSKSIIELVNYVCGKNADSFGYKYQLKHRVSGESFLSNQGNFANKVRDIIAKTTNIDTVFGTTGGTSDARFIKDYCGNMLEFGLINETAHKINEYSVISEIEDLQKIYLEILQQFNEIQL